MLSNKSLGILATTMAPKPLSSSDFPSHQRLPTANRRRTTIRSFTGFFVLLLLWQLWSFSSRVEEPTSDNHSSTLQPPSSSSHLSPSSPSSTPSSTPATPNDCPPAPALSSLFIVLQTPPNTTHSSTTAAAAAEQQQQQEALSETHYATTLRCIPHYGVFSSSGAADSASLASRALAAAPASATWFVFLDASTHVLWPNLLAYLAHFSSPAVDSWYLGEPSLVGAHVVANAGAGTVVSRGAMRRIASAQASAEDDDDEDVMVELGKTLVKAGVELTWAWPGMQSGAPSALEWGKEREGVGRLWCHRAVSYGGLTGEELEVLDMAEREARAAGTPLTRHRDVFQDFVLAQLASRMPRWDNGASRATFRKLTRKGLRSGKPIATYADCRLECDQYGECIGFAWIGRQCRFSTQFQLGRRNETAGTGGRELTSGFMMDRVDWMVRGMEDEPCRREEEWTLPWQVDSGIARGGWED